jgi:deferrochelatase/peroxidase EfeB
MSVTARGTNLTALTPTSAVRETMGPGVDLADIQGLVRFGYGKMSQAAYVLVKITNAAAARAWLRSAPITTAVTMSPPPATALQVAFTAQGLAALGVDDSIIAQFSPEFIGGMTEPSRLRRSGDVGRNDPARWAWGSGDAREMPDMVAMCFAEPNAENGGGLEAFMHRILAGEWPNGFDVIRRLDTNDIGGMEPFGFADGISQPVIDWERRRDPSGPKLDYGNVVALGEFLLGYPNEYGKYTDRPLIDAASADDASGVLLPAEDMPSKLDVGRNGTYVVMRQLEQDVRTFWQFAAEQTGGDPTRLDRLPASFVGRTRAGDPLVPIQNHAIEGIGATASEVQKNQFTFDEDPNGVHCPFGAHVRRVNPRNADLSGRSRGLAKLLAMLGLRKRRFRDDLTSSVRFHRIVRRGREYGPALSPTDALEPPPADDPPRGLHFICLNANISRQFEFLQNAWVMNTKFGGLTGTSDPLLGNREPISGCPATDDFVVERNGMPRQRVTGLPQFVTVRGGGYFFLPSLRTMRFFVGGG